MASLRDILHRFMMWLITLLFSWLNGLVRSGQCDRDGISRRYFKQYAGIPLCLIAIDMC